MKRFILCSTWNFEIVKAKDKRVDGAQGITIYEEKTCLVVENQTEIMTEILRHELTHIVIDELCKPYGNHDEEFVADLVAKYGYFIYNLADGIMSELLP